MKSNDNYFHTNKKRKEDGESSETVAPDRSSVDFVIEKLLPDCPEKHFILGSTFCRKAREVFRNHGCKYKN